MHNNIKIESLSVELYANFCNVINEYSLLQNIDRLVYLFSGGKDATIGVDLLQRYLAEDSNPLPLDLVMVAYPKHVYYLEDGGPAQCYTDTVAYWEKRGIKLTILNPQTEDFPDGDTTACRLCKQIRKSYIDPYLEGQQEKYPNEVIGVVTGYDLYDALAYMDELLLVTNFKTNDILARDPKTKNRVQNCLHKMKAREELPNGLVVIRPLINMREDMIMNYVTTIGIPYVNRGCKAAKDKHKREYFKALNVAAAINNTDYSGLLNFLHTLNIELPTTFEDIQLANYFTDC